MCDIATQQSFVSQTHLPVQEPPQVHSSQPSLQSTQPSLERVHRDRLDANQAPRLAAPELRTGVEGAFVANSAHRASALAPNRAPSVTPLESIRADVEVSETAIEEPKNFWEKIKDFMAKAFEVISDVISTVMGWLAKVGSIAGSLAGVVGRFLPGVGEFLGGVSMLSSLGGGSTERSSERAEPVNAVMPRPTPRG